MEKDLGRTVVVSVLWLRKEFPTGWTNHYKCLYLQESQACSRVSPREMSAWTMGACGLEKRGSFFKVKGGLDWGC